MPQTKYIRVIIDNKIAEISSLDKIPVSISYSLENKDNFQQKTSGKSLNLTVPASLLNQKQSNDFTNQAVIDLTAGEIYKKHVKAVIEANGQELIAGKAFLIGGKEQFGKAQSYEYNIYGDNADWLIDLKEATLYDYISGLTFIWSKSVITNSWTFDGTDMTKPYVFAPVRYAQPMETMSVAGHDVEDYNMISEYMKPSLSKYFFIYQAFKSLGYKVQSDFFDTEYFRRQVMPWTWGNFLTSSAGSRQDNLDFLAMSTDDVQFLAGGFGGGTVEVSEFVNLLVSNDSLNGAFDNNNVYEWIAGSGTMQWTYNPAFNYGLITAVFHVNVWLDAKVTNNSLLELRVQYFKNGIKLDNGNDNGNGTLLKDLDAPTLGSRSYVGPCEDWLSVNVVPGDVITCKIWTRRRGSQFGVLKADIGVDQFELDYFKIPFGGTIDFSAYTNFKNYKFLDFLTGVIDEFNLCTKTDPINKVVYFEPEHPYSLEHDQSEKTGGYFNGRILDWTSKQDLSKESIPELFSDAERELIFKYQEDNNDGSYKIYVQRNGIIPGMGKFVFPDRFKAGKAEHENRFFAPVMHYDVVQWKGLGSLPTDMPQMISLIPENVSNTSKDEAQSIFVPKSAYYKGIVPEWGWVLDEVVQNNFPYMFAVNYKTGGEEDPILSYCDEKIGTLGLKVDGVGLIRRFFLQRLRIMENGQFYKTYMKLNNTDVSNILHREFVVIKGQKYEVIEINDYKPLAEDSTEVYLRKWVPLKAND